MQTFFRCKSVISLNDNYSNNSDYFCDCPMWLILSSHLNPRFLFQFNFAFKYEKIQMESLNILAKYMD